MIENKMWNMGKSEGGKRSVWYFFLQNVPIEGQRRLFLLCFQWE